MTKEKIDHINLNCLGAEYCEPHNERGEVYYSSKNVRKLLKSQRKEIIEKIIKEKPFNYLTRDLIERNKIDKYLDEWERRINLIKEDEQRR